MSSFEIESYKPADRGDYIALLGKAWGHAGMSGEHFDWWFDGDPTGSLRSVARIDGRIVAVAGHKLIRMVLRGEERLTTFSCHATTLPEASGRGIFQALQRHLEDGAQACGAEIVLGFSSAPTTPIFLHRLGWSEVGQFRLWVRPVLRHGEELLATSLGPEGDAAAAWPGNHIVRDSRHLAWRYLQSPHGYVALRSGGGYAVVWPAKTQGGRTVSLLVDLAGPPDEIPALLGRAARVSRTRLLFALPAPEQHGVFLRAGFVPTSRRMPLLGRGLAGPLDTNQDSWRFTLGDMDFF